MKLFLPTNLAPTWHYLEGMFRGDENVLHHNCVAGYLTVNICQVTELHNKNWGILLYGHYITIKLIYKKVKNLILTLRQ